MSVPSPEAYAALAAELASTQVALAATSAERDEARAHQAATAELLRVISSSVADAQPVFEKILDSCGALFEIDQMGIMLVGDDGQAHWGAERGNWSSGTQVYPRPLTETGVAQAILERRTIHIPDVGALAATMKPSQRAFYDLFGNFSVVYAPLIRDERGIGAIVLTRIPPKPFTDKEIALVTTFADQAVIAIENARLFRETQEALERQTATAEILQVISESPTDVQPVFDAITERAMALCGANIGAMTRFDGELVHMAVVRGLSPQGTAAFYAAFPQKLGTKHLSTRALLARAPVQIPDLRTEPGYDAATVFQGDDQFGGALSVPLMREGQCIGSISVGRRETGLFPNKLVTQLQTFAAQAVIAIENVRLFNETKESLAHQTASSEVLRVISSSVADTQPVFEKILDSCAALFAVDNMSVILVRDGLIYPVAARGPWAEGVSKMALQRVEDSAVPQLFHEGRALHIPDATAMADTLPLSLRKALERFGNYSALIAPLLCDGQGIGTIGLYRNPPKPFSTKEIALLATFADQAVIAIENARLFRETQEALERQTATAEILQVISQSPTDVTPVFQAIAERALALCKADTAASFRFDGELLHAIGTAGMSRDYEDMFRALFPRKPDHKTVASRVFQQLAVVHVPDVEADPEHVASQDDFDSGGVRCILAVPMLCDGQILGALSVARFTPGLFPEPLVKLLQTFADQAVIAIENVRLFRETQEALQQQTAISDVLRVTTEWPSDADPVLNSIADHAVRLCDASAASIFLVEDHLLRHVCSRGPMAEQAMDLEPLPIDRGSMSGVAILEGIPIEVADIQAETAKYPLGAETARRLGHRSMAVTPLLREGKAFGTLLIRRHDVRPFSEREVNLLRTFGSQAAIALENVRLFNETKEALEQQTATAEVLRVISSSVADTQPVFEKILDSCERLFEAEQLAILLVRNDLLHIAAIRGRGSELVRAMMPLPINDTPSGTALSECRTLHFPSIVAEQCLSPGLRLIYERIGDYSVAIAPMAWEGRGVGTILVGRQPPRAFTDKEMALLATFADQAVIAIENERLFHEIQDKSRQLQEASQHKSQFLASMSHELRTPLNAILGFNEMILDEIYGEVPPDMREPLRDIQDSGKHLLRLINNVLDLAKIEAGRMELALAEYAVHDLVESVRATLWPLATGKGLELVTALPEELPLAYGDSGRLTQCLMNLASNSLKFTPAGRVEISIELQGDTLIFRVTDTGIGIPADKIDSLFTEFKQTDATIASEYGGTGLGLSISRKFVEMHGGRIWVESEVGRGSVFSFEIPLRVAA